MCKIEICQISIEIHGFDPKYHTTEAQFRSMFLDLLKNGDFVPMIATNADKFKRMFWLNMGSEKCIEKYLANLCI